MFTQKCFIRKNSKELQDKVYRLGYRAGTHLWERTFNTLLIANGKYFRCYDDEWGNSDLLIRKGYIDCGTNEELFLALASLQDDSDKNQWFVYDYEDNWKEVGDFAKKGDFILCKTDKYYCGTDVRCAHKATVEEIIERFKVNDMRKYWYYTFESKGEHRCGISYTDNGEFDIVEVILTYSENKNDHPVIITGWREISSSQYKSLDKYFESLKK